MHPSLKRTGIIVAISGVVVIGGLLWIFLKGSEREQECKDSFNTWVTSPPTGTVPVILTEDWCRELLTEDIGASDGD